MAKAYRKALSLPIFVSIFGSLFLTLYQVRFSKELRHAVPTESWVHHYLAVDNDSNTATKNIYVCNGNGNAIGEAKALLEDVLPEYSIVQLEPSTIMNQTSSSSERDVFLHVAGKPNCTQSVIVDWESKHFRGKRLFITGEDITWPTPFQQDMHFWGPRNPPPEQDIGMRIQRLYYLQMVYWQYVHHRQAKNTSESWLFNHDKKPINTGKYFLIYGQSNCVPYREGALDELSRLGPTRIGGKCAGFEKNINKTKVRTGVKLRNWWDNTEVYHNYRFCLVMEHSAIDGYVTEKILMAYAGGCIPIYYGTSEIFDLFNPQSFVFYNISAPQAALEQVAYLQANQTAYNEMLWRQPILAHGDKTIQDYFSFSDGVGEGKLKAQVREMLGV